MFIINKIVLLVFLNKIWRREKMEIKYVEDRYFWIENFIIVFDLGKFIYEFCYFYYEFLIIFLYKYGFCIFNNKIVKRNRDK